MRNYKIQEVIKRRQILLVQVVKEERGNKGAALTSYLSLAGRYCVLMPNSPRGGGISRKITNANDRRRLRGFMEELDMPEGMAVILRTAGVERSKAEIKRDLEYLLRAWDEIRDTTIESTAPALVYEEGNLIKRAIRDLYTKDTDEIQIDGQDAYQSAKGFMRLLMPSHAKRVKHYRDGGMPLFHRYQVEDQLESMHNPIVQLKSGGYIVISPTEALVSIDVNSGRATRGRNIEETALKTNLEAADEVARELRLRDLAGLIVIDFIDMEVPRNDRAVERQLKDAMKTDRARIQLGRISPFGLLELSRQRLRPSLMEAHMKVCPHCQGTGHLRSTESTVIHVLREIEEEGQRKRSSELTVYVPTEVALYLLNQKRELLAQIEQRCTMRIMVFGDDSLIPPNMRIERTRSLAQAEEKAGAKVAAAVKETAEHIGEQDVAPASEPAEEPSAEAPAEAAEGAGRRKRRSRRRPKSAETESAPEAQPEPAAADAESAAAATPMEAGDEEGEGTGPEPAGAEAESSQEAAQETERLKRRRRSRRGGRRHQRSATAEAEAETRSESGSESESPGEPLPQYQPEPSPEPSPEPLGPKLGPNRWPPHPTSRMAATD